MNIIVTGANGYLAERLIKYLLSSNNFVCGLSRKEAKFNQPNYKHIVVDFTKDEWEGTLPTLSFDCIIHLAQSTRYNDFPNGTKDMVKVNIESTAILLDWGRKNKVKKFIFSSTGNVYKQKQGWLIEEDSCAPISFYGTSKYCAELICEQFSYLMEIDIFRIFGLYGPNQKGMLIPKLVDTIRNRNQIQLAQGKGLFLSPIYVEDAINIITKCIGKELGIGLHIFNLAGEEMLNLDEISSKISSKLGIERNAIILDEEPKYLLGDTTKLRKVFGKYETSSFYNNLTQILES